MNRSIAAAALFLAVAAATHAQVITVPAQHPTIADAVAAAAAGDTILIAPGVYRENLVLNGKPVTLASWFARTRNPAYISQTVIDGGDAEDAIVVAVGREQRQPVVFVGLTLKNGDDCISSRGAFDFLHGRVTECADGIDYQSGSTGAVRYSVFENNRDDGIDLDDDIAVIVEHNLIRNNEGDGIEIRLHPYDGPMLRSAIRANTITGNGEDGIQFIDYPEVTNREYVVERNHIVDNRQAGIGCMSDGVTREDYRAAAIPESIQLADNFLQGNERDLSCGETVLSRSGVRLEVSARELNPAAVLLTWVGDPSSTVVVDWHLLPGTDARDVEFRRAGDTRWHSCSGDAFAFPFSERTVRRAELTGLEPDALYEIRFGNGSRSYGYRTMPRIASRPIRFAVGGDTRAAEEDFGAMNRTVATHDVDFVVFGGDLAYSNGTPAQVEREQMWYETITKTLVTDEGRLIPVLAGIGNHEVFSAARLPHAQSDSLRTRYALEHGAAPYYSALIAQGAEPYRAIDFGAYLTLLLLDSNHARPVDGAQTAWLAATLDEREPVPHVFPIYHVPAFPSVRRYEGPTSGLVREHWVPLFDEFGIRMAFENHDHVYKRTHALRNGARDSTGTVFIGDGAWGAGPREVGRDHGGERAWYIERAEATNHAVLVTLDGERALVRVIDRSGAVIDEYATTARKRVSPAADGTGIR